MLFYTEAMSQVTTEETTDSPGLSDGAIIGKYNNIIVTIRTSVMT